MMAANTAAGAQKQSSGCSPTAMNVAAEVITVNTAAANTTEIPMQNAPASKMSSDTKVVRACGVR